MSKITTDWKVLQNGMIVEEACTIKAEVKFQCTEYLCIVVRDGDDRIRLMLPVGVGKEPNPSDAEMLRAYMDGSRFFTLEEIYSCRKGKPLCKPPRRAKVEIEPDNPVVDSADNPGVEDIGDSVR